MKKLIFSAALLAASALSAHAQTTPAPNPNGDTPAVATTSEQNSTAPVAGKNSFTESQAKSRIEESGVTAVMGLKLDDQGVWQANGTKDGKPVAVSMDYQGNIVAK
jgi:hypothetical protein